MKPLRIDFAAPSLARTVFHAGPAAWALALLALALCLGAAALGAQLLASGRAYQVQMAAVRSRASAANPVLPVARQPLISEARAAAVNAAVLQLNLPWRSLHDAIAAATPNRIALLALEPDPHQRSMKITAEARNSDEMIAYIEQLKQQPLFAAVALLRHEINELDPNRPIRFQLDAQWRAE
jgi:Tfp pilus assembly protein PilN